MQVHTDSSGDASGRRGGYGVTRFDEGGKRGVKWRGSKGRALLRREMEDVAVVFQRGGENVRRDCDCHSDAVLRGDTVVSSLQFFGLEMQFCYFYVPYSE